jgi:hypothetical protein
VWYFYEVYSLNVAIQIKIADFLGGSDRISGFVGAGIDRGSNGSADKEPPN